MNLEKWFPELKTNRCKKCGNKLYITFGENGWFGFICKNAHLEVI